MTDSLRDQLLGLGFNPPKPEPKPAAGAAGEPRKHGRHAGKPRQAAERAAGRDGIVQAPKKPGPPRRAHQPPRSREDIDLARAYAIRAQREKDERIAAEKVRQDEARKRREARARLAGLVQGESLNVADAELVRHFPYGGKIKRIHVTRDQLKALNAGELGVLQMDGRYLLVTAALLAQAEAIFAPAVALKVDPDAPAPDGDYADPKYQVPDDLIW